MDMRVFGQLASLEEQTSWLKILFQAQSGFLQSNSAQMCRKYISYQCWYIHPLWPSGPKSPYYHTQPGLANLGLCKTFSLIKTLLSIFCLELQIFSEITSELSFKFSHSSVSTLLHISPVLLAQGCIIIIICTTFIIFQTNIMSSLLWYSLFRDHSVSLLPPRAELFSISYVQRQSSLFLFSLSFYIFLFLFLNLNFF